MICSDISSACGNAVVSLDGTELTPASHVIVVPSSPTAAQRHAALDLMQHLKAMTGHGLDIVDDAQACGDTRIPIIVGNAVKTLNRNGMRIDFQALGDEGICLRSTAGVLVLAGNGQRGVHYAVYSFLEDCLGCRWFTEDCVSIPQVGNIAVANLDITYIPPLEYRCVDYPSSRPLPFAVRNKLNGKYLEDCDDWGGSVTYQGFVHTFASLVPAEKYSQDHPEYYSEINGIRQTKATQLCLTNPDVLKIATETVLGWIRANPRATIFSVSQNDRINYCTCEKCRALAEYEGSQAGPLLHFVNAIARTVAAEYPGKIIDTLAYVYTRRPPKHVRPEPNVAIRLCDIECCFAHPLATCPHNASFVQDIREWHRICNRLHIWDYVIDFSHCLMPFPNLRVIQPNIQFFIENGVTGIYEEGNFFGKGGELAELRTYIMAKCLWNPKTDVPKAIAEFTDAYYGAAAPAIRKYIDIVHDAVCADTALMLTIYNSPDFLNKPAMLDDAMTALKAARDAVKGDALLEHRVNVATIPLIYTLYTLAGSTYRRTPTTLIPSFKPDDALFQLFADTVKREGIGCYRESKKGDNIKEWLDTAPTAIQPLDICVLENEAMRLEIIPARGGRLWSAVLKKQNLEIMDIHGNDEKGYNPTGSGMEIYASLTVHGIGWNAIFNVVSQDSSSVTLEHLTDDGIAISRTYRIDPNGCRFSVVNSVTAIVPHDALAVRFHPLFKLADCKSTTLDFTDVQGRIKHLHVTDSDDRAKPHDLFLADDAMPNGSWSLTDRTAGFTIVNAFTPDDIGTCFAYWNSRENVMSLELFGKKINAGPGDAVSMSASYEIRPCN